MEVGALQSNSHKLTSVGGGEALALTHPAAMCQHIIVLTPPASSPSCITLIVYIINIFMQ